MPTMLLLNSGDMPTKELGGRKLRQCFQCDGAWFSHKNKKPVRCRFCNSRAWDRQKGRPGRPPKSGPKLKKVKKGKRR